MAANSYAQLTSLSAAKAFGMENDPSATWDVNIPKEATGVLLQAETQNVRFRTDGTAPTASVGMILIAGDAPVLIEGQQNMQKLKVIEATASAKLNIQFIGS